MSTDMPEPVTPEVCAMSEVYAARICWNSRKWVTPTGEAARAESGDTYAVRMGFGHEEWLFNRDWVVEGWKYGFLQPVSPSRTRLEGKTIDLRLYAISPEHEWFYVAEIAGCEVLSESLADAARQQFDRRGWLDQMRAQVKQVNGNIAGLAQREATNLFNVRFRFENAAIHSLVPIKPTDAIRRLPRYRLAQLSGTLVRAQREWSARVKRVNVSSHRLTVGQVYTRKHLAHAFTTAWGGVREGMVNALAKGKQLINGSTYFQAIVGEIAKTNVLDAVGEEGPPHPTDSHPPLSQRLAALKVTMTDIAREALAVSPATPAITLVENVEVLEQEVTDAQHVVLVRSGAARVGAVSEEDAGTADGTPTRA